MNRKTLFILITLLIAVPAFFLGPVLWPPFHGNTVPSSGQLPFFIFLAVVEALLLGFGVAFMLFTWPLIKRLPQAIQREGILMYFSISWLLVSWWPHDNLHMHVGLNLQGLLYIEYGFHVTLITASLILTYCFVRLIRRAIATG